MAGDACVFCGTEEAMDWLAEYFSGKTPVLNISLWAYPPLLLGPEGPAVQKPHCLPYPGTELVFSPGEDLRRGAFMYEIPAHYELREPVTSHTGDGAPGAGDPRFFRSITIFAPSRYNREFVVKVNDAFSFVPVFSADGAPGFFGSCVEQAGASALSPHMRLPWCFQGYITI
jgi:hypothetical protein